MIELHRDATPVRTVGAVLAALEHGSAGSIAIPTGFQPLDDALGSGLRTRHLTVIGGAPGSGKSCAHAAMGPQHRRHRAQRGLRIVRARPAGPAGAAPAARDRRSGGWWNRCVEDGEVVTSCRDGGEPQARRRAGGQPAAPRCPRQGGRVLRGAVLVAGVAPGDGDRAARRRCSDCGPWKRALRRLPPEDPGPRADHRPRAHHPGCIGPQGDLPPARRCGGGHRCGRRAGAQRPAAPAAAPARLVRVSRTRRTSY